MVDRHGRIEAGWRVDAMNRQMLSKHREGDETIIRVSVHEVDDVEADQLHELAVFGSEVWELHVDCRWLLVGMLR
jgi:hypothetical protein